MNTLFSKIRTRITHEIISVDRPLRWIHGFVAGCPALTSGYINAELQLNCLSHTRPEGKKVKYLKYHCPITRFIKILIPRCFVVSILVSTQWPFTFRLRYLYIWCIYIVYKFIQVYGHETLYILLLITLTKWRAD